MWNIKIICYSIYEEQQWNNTVYKEYLQNTMYEEHQNTNTTTRIYILAKSSLRGIVLTS